MSDRLAQLRSLADGVGDLQHGQPGDEDHCTAADVIRWAVAEIERHTRDQQPRTKEAAPMSDENERSVASAGSVAGEPVAWAVLDSRGTVCVAYTCREAAEAYCEGTFNRLAPLYRQPQDGVVRLPPLDPNGAPGWNAAIGAVREALAKAGVDWDTE